MPEGFLDDDARPAFIVFFRKAALTQHLHNGRKEPWGHGQIEKTISERVVEFVDLDDLLVQAPVGFRIQEIAFDVVDTLIHPVP